MRRIVLLLAIVGMLLLAVVGPALAQATKFRIPLEFGLQNECTGEFVNFTGELFLESHSQDNPNNLQNQMLAVITGSGVGESGTEYQFIWPRVIRLDFVSGPGSGMLGHTNSEIRIISKDGTSNQLSNATLHVTFTPDGTPTAVVENVDSKCVG